MKFCFTLYTLSRNIWAKNYTIGNFFFKVVTSITELNTCSTDGVRLGDFHESSCFRTILERRLCPWFILILISVGRIRRLIGITREYWMISRLPGFLAVAWFGSSPHPLPPLLSASCLSFSVVLCGAGRAYWREGRGVVGGWAKSYDGQKAWSSIINQ